MKTSYNVLYLFIPKSKSFYIFLVLRQHKKVSFYLFTFIRYPLPVKRRKLISLLLLYDGIVPSTYILMELVICFFFNLSLRSIVTGHRCGLSATGKITVSFSL